MNQQAQELLKQQLFNCINDVRYYLKEDYLLDTVNGLSVANNPFQLIFRAYSDSQSYQDYVNYGTQYGYARGLRHVTIIVPTENNLPPNCFFVEVDPYNHKKSIFNCLVMVKPDECESFIKRFVYDKALSMEEQEFYAKRAERASVFLRAMYETFGLDNNGVFVERHHIRQQRW